MKILKYIKNKFRKTISVEEFADILGHYFYNNMIKNHSEFYKMLSKTGIEINQEDFNLESDWELTIFDMFIITYCCRLILTNEEICDAILDIFHSSLYNAHSEVDKTAADTIQEISKIRYNVYFKAVRSENSGYLLTKELVKNIYGKEVYDAIILGSLGIYVEGSIKFATDFINDILRKHDLELKT